MAKPTTKSADKKKPPRETKSILEEAERQRAIEQCALTALASHLTTPKDPKKLDPMHLHMSKKKHHLSLDPSVSMPHLIGKYFVGPEIAPMFDIKPHELSSLVPKIRLFRVDLDKNGKQTRHREFYFSDHTAKSHVHDLMSGKADRFNEAGIQSVNWDFLGGNPAEVKRYIEVNIKILFSSIDSLTRGPGIGPSYTDLFARITKDPKHPAGQQRKDGYYRLRLDMGWSVPAQSKVFSGERGKQLIRALEKTNKSLWLHLKNHDLNFNQDGSVELTINYLSSMEHELQRVSVIDELRVADSESNKSIAQHRKELGELKKSFDCWVKNEKKKPNGQKDPNLDAKSKHIGSFLQKKQTNLRVHNVEILEKIHRSLIKENLIREVAIENDALGYTGKRTFGGSWIPFFSTGKTIDTFAIDKKFSKSFKSSLTYGPATSFASFHFLFAGAELMKKFKAGKIKNLQQAKKAFDNAVGNLTIDKQETRSMIQYTFLGDIIDATIDVCLEISKKNRAFKNLASFLENTRMILGSVKIPKYEAGGKSFVDIPLSNMPISMNLFTAWFIKNVIDKGKTFYLLKDFLRHMLLQLVNASVGSNCFEDNDNYKNFPRNIPSIGFHTLRTDPKSPNSYPFIGEPGPIYKTSLGTIITKSDLDRPYSEAPNIPSCDLTNYLLLYTSNADLEKRKRISREEDNKVGIFSINIGSPTGIVKELTFTKTDSKYLEESLLTVKPTDMSLEAFRRIYDASIKLFGNTAFFPGQHIYVDPSTVGMGHPFVHAKTNKSNTSARLLGLGGYYLITKVVGEISPGSFTTDLTARWVGFGDGLKGRSANQAKKNNACKDADFDKLEAGLSKYGYSRYVVPKAPQNVRTIDSHVGRNTATDQTYQKEKGWRPYEKTQR